MKELNKQMLEPISGSKKVYIKGELHNLEVAMREIMLSDTIESDGTVSKNPPLRVYDTSGPFTDPSVKINIEESDGPRSIYKANEDRLNKTGNEEIRNFADLYFEIMNSKDSAFLNKSTAEDMLTFLLPTLKGKSENAN